MKYSHLAETTKAVLEENISTRLEWLKEPHFIYYEKAAKIINELERVYRNAPNGNSTRPRDSMGLTIVGPSGCGKTMILAEFMRLNPNKSSPDRERYSVAYSVLRDTITGLTGLYSSLLEAVGHPYGDHGLVSKRHIRISTLEQTLLYCLKETHAKMFIIDEFQHARGVRYQQAFLNQLKRTMQVPVIPFVASGTKDTIDVLGSDSAGQLISRLPVKPHTILDYWRYGKEFKQFLAGYEKYLPFREPSYLSSNDLAKVIFDKVKFQSNDMLIDDLQDLFPPEAVNKIDLRRLTDFLRKISEITILLKKPYISKEIIDEVDP